MIYTLTVNPSLDYRIKLEHLRVGERQHAEGATICSGGKGVNVSRVLRQLGTTSIAYGFVGGESASMYLQGVARSGIQASFLPVKKGFTRINVMICGERETQVDGPGPQIDDDELALLLRQLSQLRQGDLLVIAGDVPPNVSDTYYAQIVRTLAEGGVHCVVDAGYRALLHVLKERPFLIKTNVCELEELFHCPMREGILLSSMQALQQKGGRSILVSHEEKEAYLLDEQGAIYYGKCVVGKAVSTIGWEEAMVGGFLHGWLAQHTFVDAFRMGLAVSSASAAANGIADKATVAALLDRVEIEVLRTPLNEGTPQRL